METLYGAKDMKHKAKQKFRKYARGKQLQYTSQMVEARKEQHLQLATALCTTMSS